MLLSQMSVTEAASKALEVLLVGSFQQNQEYRKNNGLSYDPARTWQDGLAVETGYDPDDSGPLSEFDSVWQEVKYESSSAHTHDGFTAKVEAEHGGEGQGDQYWIVVSISDGLNTRYFRRDGYYASYDGGYLDGPTSEVRPTQKLVTFYEDTV